MKKEEWIQLVSKIIKQHPEWLSDTINSIQYGISQRLEDELQYSTDIEIALITSLDENTDKELLLKGVKALRRFGNTKWQEDKIKKLTTN